METMHMDETVMEQRIGREMENLYEAYGEHIDNVSGVFKDYQGRGMNIFDQYALGKMLDNYATYIKMIPEAIAQNQLGRVLPIAMDIISAAYVTSIMPAIASVQPLDELVGVIFFKKLTAGTTRQGVTAGDALFGSTGVRDWGQSGYAADLVEDDEQTEKVLSDSAGDLWAAGTLTSYPIRKRTIEGWILDETDGTTKLREFTDDGGGNLFGVGVQGTINYVTGAWETTLVGDVSDLAAGVDSIHFKYNLDLEYSPTDVPKLTWETTDKTVRARIFLLEGQWGVITEYALAKRFGKAMDVEVANDLKAEINAEVASAAIKLMYANAVGNENWSTTPPSGTSAYEHRMMFRDAITNAGQNIMANAGKGTVSYMIVGSSMFTIVSSQPGYKALSTGSEIGPHMAGMLDNISIIKAASTSLVPAAKAVAGYRGSNWFEAGVVYGPYLPLAVTGTVNIGSSLHMARGCMHAAAIDVVVPEFTTVITLT